MNDTTLIAGLLSLEQSLLYGYGEAGGTATASVGASAAAIALLQEGFAVHRARRDQLTDALAGRQAAAPAAQPAYALPNRPTDLPSALNLAAALEARAAAAYHDALGETDDGHLRDYAVLALVDAAVREARLNLAAGIGPAAAAVSLPGV